MSTTAKGNHFRDQVAMLLRAGNHIVEVEKHIGAKNADLYFESLEFNKRIRIAVECKNYERPLTRSHINEIYSDYRPLIDSDLIDRVVVVAPKPLSATVQSFVDETRFISFLTLKGMQETVMDFSEYLTTLVREYELNGLPNYFFSPFSTDGFSVENSIENWLNREGEAPPIAIIGGYGMGKTTLSSYLAMKHAKASMQGEQSRIPILIRLGEISSEQGLPGLIGKHLAATYVVRNYHYNTFITLNQLGRLFIILDGFDEMKHGITREQFIYNFREINRLCIGNARVLLLGRPTAFVSDEEREFVLSGKRKIDGDTEYREPGWPEYGIIQLAGLTRSEAHQFIRNYMGYVRELETKQPVHVHSEFVDGRIREISESTLDDLIARPVQARMLAEIASAPGVDITNFRLIDLYSHFIELVIEREVEKQERKLYSSKERKEFAREIAWWLWEQERTSNCSTLSIPDSILKKFQKNDVRDLEVIRRDLVSACFLEHKEGGFLYFPHRSFQEYLVAERIAEHPPGGERLANVASNLNSEILDFLKEFGDERLLEYWFEELIFVDQHLDYEFCEFLASAARLSTENGREGASISHPLQLAVILISCFLREEEGVGERTALKYLATAFPKFTSIRYVATCLFCGLMISGRSTMPKNLHEEIVAFLAVALLRLSGLEELSNKLKYRQPLTIDDPIRASLAQIAMSVLESDILSNRIRVKVNLKQMMENIDDLVRHGMSITLVEFGVLTDRLHEGTTHLDEMKRYMSSAEFDMVQSILINTALPLRILPTEIVDE